MSRHSSRFFSEWLRRIQANPVAWNALTGCALCASSDVVAQYYEHEQLERQRHSNHYSSKQGNGKPTSIQHATTSTSEAQPMPFRIHIRRVASAGWIGAFFGGWVYPSAYARLDAVWKGTHFSAVVQKSVVEIATVGIFVNTVSMTWRGLFVGRDPEDVVQHVVQELPTVTINDARVWLPYNMVAFGLIPAAIRPTTTLMMEAGWQTYISVMSNNYHAREEQRDPTIIPVIKETKAAAHATLAAPVETMLWSSKNNHNVKADEEVVLASSPQ